MNYIDCHNHLLPDVDDGSHDEEESLRNLRRLRSQGVTKAILTPHINSSFSKSGVTKTTIYDTYNDMKAKCEASPEEYPALFLGCEYYIDPTWENYMAPIPMAGSDVVMLELPYVVDLAGVRRAVKTARDQGYRVLLAHPEKYDAFIYQWDEALAFLRSSPDVFVQNETWDIGKRNDDIHSIVSWRFVENRITTVLGTDSHGDRRPPSFDRAVTALTEWAGDDTERKSYIDRLLRINAQEIIFS